MIDFSLISIFSILLPGGMVFFCLARRPQTPYKFLSAIILFTGVMEAVGYLFFWLETNNMPLFHLYTYVEASLIALYYFSMYSGRKIRWFYAGMLAAFLVFSIVNEVMNSNLYHYNSLQRSVECIWMIILFMVFYIDLFNKSHVPNLLKYPHYWMTSGFLLYFAGTLFINMLGDVLTTPHKISFNAYDIHSGLNIFLNIIYTIVLWTGSRELTSEQ